MAPCNRANWYAYIADELTKAGFDVKMEDMPDPHVARESIWLPFMKETLGAHGGAIIIGHSSGSEAILRYLETNRVKGAFLVSACHTDLGDCNERGWRVSVCNPSMREWRSCEARGS